MLCFSIEFFRIKRCQYFEFYQRLVLSLDSISTFFQKKQEKIAEVKKKSYFCSQIKNLTFDFRITQIGFTKNNKPQCQ